MAISYVNTTEAENIAKDIISLATDFNTEINNLFLRFSEVPSVTKEWVGNQAIVYFNKIAQDKKQYNDFANNLKDIGYKLNKDLYDINMKIKNNINEESQKGN